MKGLHKKISVGILVAGLSIGGLSFSNGSVAHAGSGKYDPLFLFLVKLFLESEGEDLLKSAVDKLSDPNEKESLKNIFRFGGRGKYEVVGVNVNGVYDSIPEVKEYKKYELKEIDYNGFVDAVRKGKLRELGFKEEYIYRVKIDRFKFIIVFF